MKKSFLLGAIAIFLVASSFNKEIKKNIYKDPNAKVEDRVNDLLGRMTLEEKIAQLSEARCDNLKEDNQVKTNLLSFDKYKNGIGSIDGFTLSVKDYANAVNTIQDYLVHKTRLGIPAIFFK